MGADQVQRQQRVAQVVKHPHEDHEVEAFAQRGHVIDAHLAELDPVHVQHLGRQPRLRQIAGVAVDPENARGAPAAHLEAVEARVAADVEHGLARQVAGDEMGEAGELVGRVVAQEMPGRGADTVEVEVLEPGAKRLDSFCDLRCVHQPFRQAVPLTAMTCPAPCPCAISQLTEAGAISNRSRLSSGSPSTWATTPRITSQWLTHRTGPPP